MQERSYAYVAPAPQASPPHPQLLDGSDGRRPHARGFVPQIAQVERLADVTQAEVRQRFVGRGSHVPGRHEDPLFQARVRLDELFHEQVVAGRRPQL